MTAVFEMEEGISLTAEMLPWQRIIVAPSHEQPQNQSEPTSMLQLQRVYGFNRQGLRNMVAYTSSKELVMATGTMGVIMNSKDRQQRFYQVSCI